MNPSGGKACPEGSRRIRIGVIAILSAAGFGISVYAAARVAVAPRIGAPSASKVESHQPAPRINFAKLPMSFEPNLGQSDPRVKFLSRGPGYTLFLTADEAVLSMREPSAGSRPGSPLSFRPKAAGERNPESGISRFGRNDKQETDQRT